MKIGAALLARRSDALPGEEHLIAEARAFAARASRSPGRLQLCLALEQPLAYLYFWGETPGSFTPPGTAPWTDVSRLEMLSSLAGASASEPASIHYVVETDVHPGWEQEFNDWYDKEHLPGLARVPGCASASRLRNPDASPRYHACYDLVSAQVLEHPAWLAVRHSAWSDRVRPRFMNTRRLMFRMLLLEAAGAQAAEV